MPQTQESPAPLFRTQTRSPVSHLDQALLGGQADLLSAGVGEAVVSQGVGPTAPERHAALRRDADTVQVDSVLQTRWRGQERAR